MQNHFATALPSSHFENFPLAFQPPTDVKFKLKTKIPHLCEPNNVFFETETVLSATVASIASIPEWQKCSSYERRYLRVVAYALRLPPKNTNCSISDLSLFIRVFLEHQTERHQGVDCLRAVVQQQFAIVELRAAMRTVVSRCVTSRKRRADTLNPIIADFPRERLAYREPTIINTGIDYFGPYYVSVERSTEKRWGFLQ